MDLSEIYTIKRMSNNKMYWLIGIGLFAIGVFYLSNWTNIEADKIITGTEIYDNTVTGKKTLEAGRMIEGLQEKRDECATFGADIDSEGNCHRSDVNPLVPVLEKPMYCYGKNISEFYTINKGELVSDYEDFKNSHSELNCGEVFLNNWKD